MDYYVVEFAELVDDAGMFELEHYFDKLLELFWGFGMLWGWME